MKQPPLPSPSPLLPLSLFLNFLFSPPPHTPLSRPLCPRKGEPNWLLSEPAARSLNWVVFAWLVSLLAGVSHQAGVSPGSCLAWLMSYLASVPPGCCLTWLLSHLAAVSLTWLLSHSPGCCLTWLLSHLVAVPLTWLLSHLAAVSRTWLLSHLAAVSRTWFAVSPGCCLTHPGCCLIWLLSHSPGCCLTWLLSHLAAV